MKKKIVIVCFICTRDYALIPLFYGAVRRLSQELPIVFVYDCNEEPPNFKGHNTAYIKSNFERKGNLNGKECIQGMTDIYIELLNKYNFDIIIKADADCFIVGLSWLAPLMNGYNMAGFQCCNGLYCTGVCYALDKQAIIGIQEYIQHNDIEPHGGYHLAEDLSFTLLVLLSGNKVNMLNNKEKLFCLPMLNEYVNSPAVFRSCCGVVHLGQYQRIEPLVHLGLDRTDIIKNDFKLVFRALSPKEFPQNWYDIPAHSVIAQH